MKRIESSLDLRRDFVVRTIRRGRRAGCDTCSVATDTGRMASYTLNKKAVAHIRKLIEDRQYVLDSDWGEAQPSADDENAYLNKHDWDDYAGWHVGLTDGATDETKGRYAFVVGDFRRVHRSGIIACHFRAAEWRHKAIELAAHDLLQVLDKKAGIA
jgi:hypothetical protein